MIRKFLFIYTVTNFFLSLLFPSQSSFGQTILNLPKIGVNTQSDLGSNSSCAPTCGSETKCCNGSCIDNNDCCVNSDCPSQDPSCQGGFCVPEGHY